MLGAMARDKETRVQVRLDETTVSTIEEQAEKLRCSREHHMRRLIRAAMAFERLIGNPALTTALADLPEGREAEQQMRQLLQTRLAG
jgi:ribosomal 50S subunit-associated protein YjgA (DUF615 family)